MTCTHPLQMYLLVGKYLPEKLGRTLQRWVQYARTNLNHSFLLIKRSGAPQKESKFPGQESQVRCQKGRLVHRDDVTLGVATGEAVLYAQGWTFSCIKASFEKKKLMVKENQAICLTALRLLINGFRFLPQLIILESPTGGQ